jgi:hypothetical protein
VIGAFFAVLGTIALLIGLAVDLQTRGPERRAAKRAARRADRRSFLDQQSISRRRPMLVPHDEFWAAQRIEPLDPKRPVNLRVVPTHAPRDKR